MSDEFNGCTAVEGQSDTPKQSNDVRLKGIEEQIEIAENKCNNLKDQLNYMKQMYLESPRRNSTGNVEVEPDEDESSHAIYGLTRQKSNQIGTDNSGSAVKTINNILNGITNSVNRLSEIHSQITSPHYKDAGVSPKESDTILEESTHEMTGKVVTVPELKIDSSPDLLPKRILKKKTKKSDNIKTKKSSFTHKSAGTLDKTSSTIVRKLSNAKNNVVEIYHNEAVKLTDSDESNLRRSRQMLDQFSEVPPLNIYSVAANGKEPVVNRKEPYQNGLVNRNYDHVHAPRNTMSYHSRNYELPTVASRMKQVAKSYLGNLNLKTIPFCAAISTTQSHNIGINIQQVMNIIKNRQPINGISPTLAHNIGLAAEKVHSKPFSSLVTAINSRISQTASKCPLSRATLNIQQLQEEAKLVDDVIEEGDENTSDSQLSPVTQTVIITGPSGDQEVKTKSVSSWKANKMASEECTCLPVPKLHHKYSTEDNSTKNRTKRYKSAKSISQMKSQESMGHRERNLRDVLSNLHDEFAALDRTYQELVQRNDGACVQELEQLEANLTRKEEEISMVMDLYKEVSMLKQQLSTLKQREGHEEVPPQPNDKFKEAKAAYHLTKLLKQIQQYQKRYKTTLCQDKS